MTLHQALPLLLLATSLVPGAIIFFLPQSKSRLRTGLNLSGAVAKVALVVFMLWRVELGEEFEYRQHVLPDVELILRGDALALLFVSLSAALWLLTTMYAVGYLEHGRNRSRFFGFFSLCVAATVGIAMAGNLFSFFFFYELLTLSTYPLVVHRGTPEALRAGNIYLFYTLAGGAVLLTGIVWLYGLFGAMEFVPGGTIAPYVNEHALSLRLIFLLLIVGVAVKAAMVPLHGWLPRAMVAPAPVSALLHAVAVVKAGAFGVMRIVYEVFGLPNAHALDVLTPLAVAAAVTILWGSLQALRQDDLKRRLAYSTVSQVSYIVLGIALIGPVAAVGALVHLVHQGVMKITLFFCAGNLAETIGIYRISDMNGVARRMPLTMAAFSIAALGMIGAPYTAGYISKHYLTEGAALAGSGWAAWVLTVSSVLNAAYFLPILARAWLLRPKIPAGEGMMPRIHEARALLLWPTIVGGTAVVAAALLADINFSPLAWARLIAAREYQHMHGAPPGN